MPAITGVEFREFSAAHHNANRNWLLVVLKTDDPAIVGLGDASAMDYAPQVKGLVVEFVERYMIGRDPWDSHALWTTIYHDLRPRRGRLVQSALAGLDIALWDIKGKLAGLPVFKLLGGALREQIRVYANGWYTNPGTPQQNADEARAVVDMGYTALKFDPFGREGYYQISRDDENLAVARVAAVRQAVGPDVDIMVEAHARWDAMNAIQIGKRMEAFRPFWYEEPVSEERVCELVDVRSKVNIPIATGEKLYDKFVFADIVEAHAADVLQPDIANCGGITELVKIANIAECKHITIAPHNVCSPVGAMAEMHLGAAITNFEIEEYHAEFYSPHYFTVCDGFPRQVDGYVTLDDAPGLGLTLNDQELATHPKLERVSSRGGRRKGI